MKQRLLITSAVLIATALLLAFCVNGCSTYKFGLKEEDYPEYFGEDTNLNRVRNYNSDYSCFTELPIGEDRIEVEHSVIASEEDIRHLGLDPGDYLFSCINVGAPNVSKIKLSHEYGGQPLESVGTFIFKAHRLENGEPDRSTPGWDIKAYDGGPLPEEHNWGFVRIYKLPQAITLSPYVPKAYWFTSSLDERIEIRVDGEGTEEVYEFELRAEWHKAWSVWWGIMTRT